MKGQESGSNWVSPPKKPVLATGEVHLWKAAISEVFHRVVIDDLSEKERRRLMSFKAEKARRQVSVSLWATRKILASYLCVAARELIFETSENGKPRLLSPDCSLQFNRSHSGDCWILAVSRNALVGVDIEEMKDRPQIPAIAERWFPEAEKKIFGQSPLNEQKSCFYKTWTCLEAVLKAEGGGLGQLSNFPVIAKDYCRTFFMPSSTTVGCVAARSVPTGFFEF